MQQAAQTAFTGNDPLAFEPIQLNEKLAFLACYSHYVIALQCEHQDQQASELFASSRDVCRTIQLDAEEIPQFPAELHDLIANKFGLQADHPELAISRFVAAEVARPLIIVKGCERLSDRALTAVCGFANRLGVGLTLFTGRNLAKKIDPAVANVLHTTVRKLNSRDIKHLLHRRAKSDVRLSDAEIQSVADQSRGSIQKADGLLTELMAAERKNLGLPFAHMSMLILFIAIVVGAFLMIPTDDTVTKEVAVTPATMSKTQQISTRSQQNDSITGIAQSSNLERRSPTLRESTQHVMQQRDENFSQSSVRTAQITQSDEVTVASASNIDAEESGVEVEAVATLEESSSSEPILLDSADPNAWVNRLPATAAGVEMPYGAALSQDEWLLTADPGAYTLQIMGSHDESRIKAFVLAHPGYEHFGYFETRHLNQPWFVLTYGRYSDRDTAVDAIGNLPAPLKAQKPWARGVKTVRGG